MENQPQNNQSPADNPPPQLKMLRALTDLPPIPALPEGLCLRTLTAADAAGYAKLLHANGELGEWDQTRVEKQAAEWIPFEDTFVVTDAAGAFLATACTCPPSGGCPPDQAELGWVAAHPAARGQGLGRVVCLAAMHRALAKGYQQILLRTDDFRLPALRLYFSLGFAPDLDSDPSYPARWEAIRVKLAAM
jgi:mycothiol synthase